MLSAAHGTHASCYHYLELSLSHLPLHGAGNDVVLHLVGLSTILASLFSFGMWDYLLHGLREAAWSVGSSVALSGGTRCRAGVADPVGS